MALPTVRTTAASTTTDDGDRPKSSRAGTTRSDTPLRAGGAAAASQLRSSLHGRGQRLTPQRQRVLALFESIGEGRHLSAEDVHQGLAESQERISLATVYRTLRLLNSMGLLLELELPEGGRRYELAGEAHRDHHHLVCVGCGRTEEFESLPVLQAGGDAAGRLGFQLLDCVLNVRALCPDCRADQALSTQA